MSKRRKPKSEELMLIPFLDILCSLIGVLVLIIVALCVAQTQRAKGITTKQFETAQKHQKLLQELKPLKEQENKLSKTLEEQKKDQDRTEELEKQKKNLEESLRNAAEESRKNKEEHEKLTGQLSDIKAKLEDQKQTSPPLQDEIKRLEQTLAARQNGSTVKMEPKLVIRPSGSGLGGGRIFFAEAFPNGILLHLGGKETFKFRLDGLRDNPDYRRYLTRIREIPGSSLIFLIRRGGEQSYKLGGGVAEFDFGLKISKIPLPEGGEVDLSGFDTPGVSPLQR